MTLKLKSAPSIALLPHELGAVVEALRRVVKYQKMDEEKYKKEWNRAVHDVLALSIKAFFSAVMSKEEIILMTLATPTMVAVQPIKSTFEEWGRAIDAQVKETNKAAQGGIFNKENA